MEDPWIRNDEAVILGSRSLTHKLTLLERLLLHILTNSCLREHGIRVSFPAPCLYTVEIEWQGTHLKRRYQLISTGFKMTFSTILRRSDESTVSLVSPRTQQRPSRNGSKQDTRPSQPTPGSSTTTVVDWRIFSSSAWYPPSLGVPPKLFSSIITLRPSTGWLRRNITCLISSSRSAWEATTQLWRRRGTSSGRSTPKRRNQ